MIHLLGGVASNGLPYLVNIGVGLVIIAIALVIIAIAIGLLKCTLDLL